MNKEGQSGYKEASRQYSACSDVFDKLRVIISMAPCMNWLIFQLLIQSENVSLLSMSCTEFV